MFLRALLFLVCLFSLGAAPIKVACVGDSITEGGGLGTSEKYPARLQSLLGTNYNVQNYGVSGRTLLKKGDFPYWNEPTYTNSRTFNPDIVIIQLGTNDGKPYNWVYGTNFVTDYKALIAVYAALPSAPRIFLCTPCPVFGNGSFDINPGTVRTNIAPAVRGLGSELSLPVIDLQARLTNSVWFPDSVHPDPTGTMAMAAVMFEGLAGGLPAGDPPALIMERQTTTRYVLSWPTNWGGLMPRTVTAFGTNKPNWVILQTVNPFNNGTMIRQTNNLANVAQRYFQLARP